MTQSDKIIGKVLYSDKNGIHIVLTKEAKHDPKIMQFLLPDRTCSVEITIDKKEKPDGRQRSIF